MLDTTVAHYRVEVLLGRGGMGQVYRARDTRLDRPVALKVITPEGADQATLVTRFFREARAASALNHPNIVTIHEVGQTDEGAYYLVQELVDGATLRERIADGLSVETATGLARQLAAALGAAHQAGIVHRDIKPENVMVRPDGYLKVLDFGIARMVTFGADDTQATTASGPTQAGMLLGTTSYMSPEQALGRPVGPASDVFALGIVLYEMLTGRRPFTGSGVGVLQAILMDEPPPPSRLQPAVPAVLDDLMAAMLAKDPARRPPAVDVERRLTERFGGTLVVNRASAVSAQAIVGRDRERQALIDRLDEAVAGRGGLVAITGEPGIGKTTLVEDALAAMAEHASHPAIARGRCSERLAGSDAYLPLLEVLDNLLRDGTGGFGDMLRSLAPTWYGHLAPAAHGGVEGGARVEAASQERMKRELAGVLAGIARLRPVVLLIEDLHWADVSTIDLLNYLAGRLAQTRVLVLLTYRPADMAVTRHPFLAIQHELEARGLFRELALEFLTADDVARYLSVQFPGHDLPAAFGRMLHDKTEGSPLFMVDLLSYLRDRGIIVREGDEWRLAASVPDVARDLPATLKGAIARKIDRLQDLDRRLLATASVQGLEFDTAIISEALDLDPADVEEHCETLDQLHRLVQPIRISDLPDRTLSVRYRFVHVLYQHALYASLQPTRRAALAGRVARALERHGGTEAAAPASELAMLFETARDSAASARYYHAAAQHAMGLFGFTEALWLADRGLAVLAHLPDDPARKGQELALQMARGAALRSITGWATPELEQTFTRARELCQQLGDPPAVFPVLWAITLFHLIRGNLVECRDRADELMALAEPSGRPELRMAAHHMAGVSREFLGQMFESSRLLEIGCALHDPAQHDFYTATFGMDPGMILRAMSSRPLWALGYPDRALARARDTLRIARSQQQPLTRAFALVVLHGVLAYRGDPEALQVGDENIALCREHGLPQEREWSRSFQGGALIALGRVDEGIALLQDSLSVQYAIDTRLARPMYLALLADGFCRAGRVDEGCRAVEEGLACAAETGEAGYVAELHRVRGQLAQQAGDAAAAERSLREALRIAGQQQAKSFELRAATALVHLLGDAGCQAQARAVLMPILDWFTEGFATADLVAARSALADLA